MKITYRVNKWAPEQSGFSVDGKVFAPPYSRLASELGVLVIEGRKKEAEDRIKRIIRSQYKKPRRCTIGFYEKGTKRFFYTSQLIADDSSLSEKLRVYKQWKQYCKDQNCIMHTHDVTQGAVIPGQPLEKGKVIEIKGIADIRRPIKVYISLI